MKVPKLKISTEDLHIAPLSVGEAADVAEMTDAEARARLDFLPDDFGPAEAQALLAAMHDRHMFHGVRRRDNGALIGVIGVHADAGMRLEIGYWFAAAVRGQGVAFQAVSQMVAQLVALCPGAQIEAECAPHNVKSWALLRRLGFQPMGLDGKRAGRRLLRFHAHAAQRIDVC